MTNYLAQILSTRRTPQALPIPGTDQVPNSAGGYAWALDDWARLDRFLVLGCEGGTYYAGELTLGVENAGAVLRCLADDGLRVVRRVVELSESGRAPKNDPALFALALALAKGDEPTRRAAVEAVPRVARTGTHLFQLVGYADGMRGWGRGLRRAVRGWYEARGAGDLAYQAVKYQARGGWSHRDLLRLTHPRFLGAKQEVAYWMVKGWPGVGDEPHPDEALRLLWAFERAKRATTAAEVAALIREHRLPREAVPTQHLTDPAVWEALLADMPATALIRNLAMMTRVGLLVAGSQAARAIVARIGDAERLRRARIHPIALLSALTVYAQGHGARGTGTWEPVGAVVDALDAAFYAAFQGVEPTGRRHVLALDVSGSMDAGAVAGVPGLTPRLASAAMALVTAATEPACQVVAFSAPAGGGYGGQWGGGDPGIAPLSISPRQRLDDVVRAAQAIPMGGTDCSLPMRWALKHRVEADVFVVYTDSETWAGRIHPVQALREYRQRTGIPARLVVVGMVSNGFTIADPDDGGMLDVVGFDAAGPALIADFVRG
jgi:60 kDa SS-A/Ro ribonucleoprotein